MTLFGDRAATEQDRAVSLVEQTLAALGVDPAQSRLPGEGEGRRFSLRRGSAAIQVTVHPPPPGEEVGTLRVVAPVVRLPSGGPSVEMLLRLLRANAEELVGVAFGITEGEVVLLAERSTRDLDASEVDAMIRTVGREADRCDDVLAEEFGTTRSCDPRPA
ncbi:MAG: YbjN domain-containing protein [Myxococcota bacterium]